MQCNPDSKLTTAYLQGVTTSSQPFHVDFVSADFKVNRWISWNYFQRRGIACALTVNNNRSLRFGYKGPQF